MCTYMIYTIYACSKSFSFHIVREYNFKKQMNAFATRRENKLGYAGELTLLRVHCIISTPTVPVARVPLHHWYAGDPAS